MATCKECYHTEVCTKHNRMVQIDEHTWDEYEQLDNVEKFCEHYTPIADVVEVKHGDWIQLSEPRLVDDIKQIHVECSNCKIQRYIPAIEQHGYYYCPNCGARMDGGKAK